jgi:Transposase domain (DUF772)
MLGKSPRQQQTELFKNLLDCQINPKHPPVSVSPGHHLGKDRGSLRSALWQGRLAEPLHQKNGCPVDAQTLYNLSDERVVAMWQENLYYQYLAGEATFQWGQPCAALDIASEKMA